tara:strand:- start:766 stop:1452 length:687 start_codon:yes stop_codon:yes gene_type:complete
MNFPITIVDDFLKNPDELITYADNIDFEKTNAVPGYRSKDLSEINYELFTYVGKKMLSILYPHFVNNTKNDIQYNATAFFQKTKTNADMDGWIHADDNYLTTILYLSKDYDYGTNFYKKKFDYITGDKICYDDYPGQWKKHAAFNGDINNLDDIKKSRSRNNLDFEKTMSVKGLYNRLIMFDPNNHHAVDVSKNMNEDKDRLILMYFFWDIKMQDGRLRLPISESRTF